MGGSLCRGREGGRMRHTVHTRDTSLCYQAVISWSGLSHSLLAVSPSLGICQTSLKQRYLILYNTMGRPKQWKKGRRELLAKNRKRERAASRAPPPPPATPPQQLYVGTSCIYNTTIPSHSSCQVSTTNTRTRDSESCSEDIKKEEEA